jgi:hypothetical protein
LRGERIKGKKIEMLSSLLNAWKPLFVLSSGSTNLSKVIALMDPMFALGFWSLIDLTESQLSS